MFIYYIHDPNMDVWLTRLKWCDLSVNYELFGGDLLIGLFFILVFQHFFWIIIIFESPGAEKRGRIGEKK